MSLKNPVTPLGIDPGTVLLVAQRLNHYATPGPDNKIYDEHKHNLYSKKTSGRAEVKINTFLHFALGSGVYSFALRLLYSGRQGLYD